MEQEYQKYPDKRDIFAMEFLVSAWKKIGIPKYL